MKRRIVSPKSRVPSKTSWRLPRPWVRSEKGGRLIIIWKTLASYIALFALLGWGAASTGLFFFIKYSSGYSEVRYIHIAGLPWTLDDYRKAKGQFWLKSGLKNAELGQWRVAFEQLRLGLPAAPENQEARLTLAGIYLMVGRPDMARPILLDGLKYKNDQTSYLRTAISFLFNQQADDAVVEMANNILANSASDISPEIKRMLVVARIYAYFNRDKFAEASAAIRADQLEESIEGRFIESRIAWETGDREAALSMLHELHRLAPRDGEIYRMLVQCLRHADRIDGARRVVLARLWSWPENPDAYIDYLALTPREDGDTRQRTLDDFFKQFAQRPDMLVKLSSWSAQEGEADLAWRIVTLLKPQSAEARSATLLALEAELQRKAYAQAAEKTAAALGSGLGWSEPQKLTLAGMEAIAQLGLGLNSEANSTLNRVLTSARVPANSLTFLARYCEIAGDRMMAVRLLRRATELDPLHQASLVALLRLELELQNLDNALPLIERLPGVRKPPVDLMTAMIDNLESDRYLFVHARGSVIDSLRTRVAVLGSSEKT